MELPKAHSLTNDVWMVPCRITDSEDFIPLLKPYHAGFINKNTYSARISWKIEEDLALKQLVEFIGPQKWSCIAKELNIAVHQSFPVRKGKQCRERWINQLGTNLRNKPWTKKEDGILKSMQKKIGNKWSQIKNFLQDRTENQVKNRWKKINRQNDQKTKKITACPTKDIKNVAKVEDLYEKIEPIYLDLENNDATKNLQFEEFCLSKLLLDNDQSLPLEFKNEANLDIGSSRKDCLVNLDLAQFHYEHLDDFDRKIEFFEGLDAHNYSDISLCMLDDFSENLNEKIKIDKEVEY